MSKKSNAIAKQRRKNALKKSKQQKRMNKNKKNEKGYAPPKEDTQRWVKNFMKVLNKKKQNNLAKDLFT